MQVAERHELRVAVGADGLHRQRAVHRRLAERVESLHAARDELVLGHERLVVPSEMREVELAGPSGVRRADLGFFVPQPDEEVPCLVVADGAVLLAVLAEPQKPLLPSEQANRHETERCSAERGAVMRSDLGILVSAVYIV
jgi:hypothetical protein